MMGFFKSMRELHQEAIELEKTMPPVGERMRQAEANMAKATQSMAAQTQAINESFAAASSGVDATATIVAGRSIGAVNATPLMEFELTVLRDGMPPYSAMVRQAVNPLELPQLQAGASVPVRVDPNNPSAVWLSLNQAP
jgi:hypothetical protein